MLSERAMQHVQTDLYAQRKRVKKELCEEFFKGLCDLLKDKYEVVASCNNDMSAYLVPIGTEDQITYYGKPNKSFRISDHWNWYANVKKCKHEWYVQCLSEDMPRARKREDEHATKPRYGYQVAVFTSDKKYKAVFGEVFNRKTGTWEWLETKPEEVIKNLGF